MAHEWIEGEAMDEQFLDMVSAVDVSRLRVVNAPASTSWDFPAIPEPRIHRIHPYPAKFPAFLTSKALSYARRAGLETKSIADIFCGCGTVAYEARRAGVDFWGCDVNPVATLIAKTKSGKYSPERVRSYAGLILEDLYLANTNVDLAEAAVLKLRDWFEPDQFDDLARLLNAIKKTVPVRSRYREVFLCAFSAILKRCSQWRQRSIKPSFDRSKKPASVKKAFESQCSFMIDAFKQSGLELDTKQEINLANVLTLSKPKTPVDLIITSPPYVTSYEYADLHQLSSLWLGFASDHRDLRIGSIGSTQHNLNLGQKIDQLNLVGTQVVFALFNEDRRAARAVANYYLDMQNVAIRCRQFVSDKGIAVFVIGNTRYCGVEIDNASHLTEALLHAGFGKVRITRRQISNKAATPFRSNLGRFSRTETSTQIYAHEYVVIAHL
ncbi:class I SAM-dependent methyltransferase [Pseudomonas syringae]|uniref:class I SAM-dependent methyltransferase n=1 Tax=Pseudomonas syringae TaxID=317 RepID=UPI0023F6EB4E|nr:class I SAM-dependent methyltransferase [Pseudomonas syringae]MDF7796075.1 class I SAM-dependent methyltransferase [Pseudomonas syringae]